MLRSSTRRAGPAAAVDLAHRIARDKDAALHAMADALVAETPRSSTANAVDVQRAAARPARRRASSTD